MNDNHLPGEISSDTLSSHQNLRLQVGSTKGHLIRVFLLFHGGKSSEIICFRFESLVRVLISWFERSYKCRISVMEETSMEKLKNKVIVTCISLMGFVSF